MAMVKCGECGRGVSDQAPYCPNCGKPRGEQIAQVDVEESVAPGGLTCPYSKHQLAPGGTRCKCGAWYGYDDGDPFKPMKGLLIMISVILLIFLTKNIWAAWIIDGITYKDAYVTPAQRADNIRSTGNMIAYPLLVIGGVFVLFVVRVWLGMIGGRKWHKAF